MYYTEPKISSVKCQAHCENSFRNNYFLTKFQLDCCKLTLIFCYKACRIGSCENTKCERKHFRLGPIFCLVMEYGAVKYAYDVALRFGYGPKMIHIVADSKLFFRKCPSTYWIFAFHCLQVGRYYCLVIGSSKLRTISLSGVLVAGQAELMAKILSLAPRCHVKRCKAGRSCTCAHHFEEIINNKQVSGTFFTAKRLSQKCLLGKMKAKQRLVFAHSQFAVVFM